MCVCGRSRRDTSFITPCPERLESKNVACLPLAKCEREDEDASWWRACRKAPLKRVVRIEKVRHHEWHVRAAHPEKGAPWNDKGARESVSTSEELFVTVESPNVALEFYSIYKS